MEPDRGEGRHLLLLRSPCQPDHAMGRPIARIAGAIHPSRLNPPLHQIISLTAGAWFGAAHRPKYHADIITNAAPRLSLRPLACTANLSASPRVGANRGKVPRKAREARKVRQEMFYWAFGRFRAARAIPGEPPRAAQNLLLRELHFLRGLCGNLRLPNAAVSDSRTVQLRRVTWTNGQAPSQRAPQDGLAMPPHRQSCDSDRRGNPAPQRLQPAEAPRGVPCPRHPAAAPAAIRRATPRWHSDNDQNAPIARSLWPAARSAQHCAWARHIPLAMGALAEYANSLKPGKDHPRTAER